ncbi:type II toxin-antitoxin system RelE/ParE family toxin [Micromonospora cathayae]|uniref:Type II toxin-antitoxin system RelE/ParE family toxin n=1 Tax=Micromonospora cathayae TaxID=3028804 RepID=A0ABY7ZWX5_9ACTN|nr:type II toxin-antitoxin system RelE/ParE family toxin [Micromonospora sp. HUAS 3]WDZ86958.1 type II toxin-antitoxin system RelE/ParE family toxin [Micromonospora sp. HUAS 3]
MGTTGNRRWSVRVTGEVRQWLRDLRQADPSTYHSVSVAIDMLAEVGPALGRPLVDTLRGSQVSNLKELRPRSGRDVAVRVLFVFDPWSQAVLLVTGNKAGNWTRWYDEHVPLAEKVYKTWLDQERERRGKG